VKNASVFLFCGLCLCALILLFAILCRNEYATDFSPYIFTPSIVPIFIALARFLQTKNKFYELTSERLKITEGVFNKVNRYPRTLSRERFGNPPAVLATRFRVENIYFDNADISTPAVVSEAVPQKVGLADKIRNAIENVRMRKRVRELAVK